MLLKSGEAATGMLQDIGKFAASTPFQKMEIAESAQKLLAFNVPAQDVMTSIRQIGDISALTGNSITEMAELYGKANVQGRLFMEDINQLTGRGIPIIQNLASQFGVTEGAVRGLVSSGQVTATHLQTAFAQMTSAGGQFAGGMDQLSQTTGGKLSTLKDRVIEIATAYGSKFLPMVNRAIDSVSAGFASLMPFVDGYADKMVALASWIGSTWQSVMPNITKPLVTAFTMAEFAVKNWKDVARLAAASAILGVIRFASELQHHLTVGIPAVLSWFGRNWQDVFKTAFNFVKTSAVNLGVNLLNLWDSVIGFIEGRGFNFEWTPLLDGFKSTIKEMPNIPDRAISEMEKRMVGNVERLGSKVGEGFQNMLAPRLAKLTAMQNKVASKSVKTAVKSAEQMQKAGEGIKTKNDFANAAKKQTQEVKFAGAMQRGSDGATTAIVKAMMNRNDPQTKAVNKTTQAVKKIGKDIVAAVKSSEPAVNTQPAV